PVLYGNLPPREISMKDVFRSGDSSKKFKIAEGQWYRYAPSYVSPAYHLLEGFPFIQEPPSGDLDRKSGSAGMPRPISYAVFCLKKKIFTCDPYVRLNAGKHRGFEKKCVC